MRLSATGGSFDMMRVLLTGGYGCIGAWTVHELLNRGAQVWIYDLAADTRRLSHLLDADAMASVGFIAGDVADDATLAAAVERVQASHILHLAGLQVPTCRAEPLTGARVNVLGTLAVFEAAKQSAGRVQRVVYASSAAVHGPAEAPGAVGDEVRLAPLTHYGAFKVCNELNARVYYLDDGINSVGLRPWTVYGVGRDFGLTSEPTRAIKAAAVGRPYAISYGGLQDLQYVRDVASDFVHALDAPFKGAEAFNVRGAVVPIETFVATLQQVAPSCRGQIGHGTRQLPIAPDLDDSRLQTQLGPLSRTPLETGIRETYERFQSLHAQGRLDLGDLPE